MADSGARLARRVADQERLAALTLQAQELADSFAAEDALADQEEAASLADFDKALTESLRQAECKEEFRLKTVGLDSRDSEVKAGLVEMICAING